MWVCTLLKGPLRSKFAFGRYGKLVFRKQYVSSFNESLEPVIFRLIHANLTWVFALFSPGDDFSRKEGNQQTRGDRKYWHDLFSGNCDIIEQFSVWSRSSLSIDCKWLFWSVNEEQTGFFFPIFTNVTRHSGGRPRPTCFRTRSGLNWKNSRKEAWRSFPARFPQFCGRMGNKKPSVWSKF